MEDRSEAVILYTPVVASPNLYHSPVASTEFCLYDLAWAERGAETGRYCSFSVNDSNFSYSFPETAFLSGTKATTA